VDVFVANEQAVEVDETRLSRLAAHVLSHEELDDDAELSVLLVAGDHIRKLNARFAGDDYATDVLSFPMMEDDDSSILLGDVVICPEIAAANAAKAGYDLGAELDLLLVHGILHLLGYDHDDEDEKARMDARQQELLASFGASVV
jgi:probable rRNA maturation factor